MTKIYILLAIAIVLLIVFKILIEKLESTTNSNQEYFPYVRRKYLLTRKERELFTFLQQTYGQEFYIFPQIHIASLLYIKNRERKWRTYFNKIIRKSVDFVVFDRQDMGSVVAIELDDKTHERGTRIFRDSFVNGAFKAAGIPLIHIKIYELEDKIEIRKKIDSILSRT